MAAAFAEGVREVSPMHWNPQTAEFGQSWLRNRLSESSVNYLTVRDTVLDRARTVGRFAASAAEADGKAEIQVRHLQEALRRLAAEGSAPTLIAGIARSTNSGLPANGEPWVAGWRPAHYPQNCQLPRRALLNGWVQAPVAQR